MEVLCLAPHTFPVIQVGSPLQNKLFYLFGASDWTLAEIAGRKCCPVVEFVFLSCMMSLFTLNLWR